LSNVITTAAPAGTVMVLMLKALFFATSERGMVCPGGMVVGVGVIVVGVGIVVVGAGITTDTILVARGITGV